MVPIRKEGFFIPLPEISHKRLGYFLSFVFDWDSAKRKDKLAIKSMRIFFIKAGVPGCGRGGFYYKQM